MFLKTPEPPILDQMEYTGFVDSTKFAYTQVWKTLKEIMKFKVLFLFIIAYLLFYDGVNTINGLATAVGESLLRLNPIMNYALILTVNFIAVPMSIVFGKVADKKGTKFTLILALSIYCFAAVTAVGFAPLELEDDHDRYDFQYEWDEENDVYQLTTLYDRGIDGWVSEDSEGDADFRNAFGTWMNFKGEESQSGSAGGIFNGLSALLVIAIATAGVGFAMMALIRKNIKWIGVVLILIIAGGAIFGTSLLFSETKSAEDSLTTSITESEAQLMVAAFDDVSDHRFSIYFKGGNESGQAEIGDKHPTQLDQGGYMDWWPETLRTYIWEPFGIGVSLQWIILGIFIGCVMGAAGAQARTMFTMLIPKTRTTEFFGFFGFIGKAAAMTGPFLYAFTQGVFDDRVALLSIVIVIIIGTVLCGLVDLEKGIQMADEEDARVLNERENE